jgi:hypothetical protein
VRGGGNGTQGNYGAAYFQQNIHFALLGNNTVPNADPAVAEMSAIPQTLLLNKKLFNVHAEHHHTFAPYWMKQFEPVGNADPVFENAIPIGQATAKSAYMVTFRDNIKLKTRLSARGNIGVRSEGGVPPPDILGWSFAMNAASTPKL